MRMLCFSPFLTAIILLLPSVGTFANTAKDGMHEEPAWGIAIEGFRLALRSAKSKYTVGQEVDVKVLLQNVDTKTQKAVFFRDGLAEFNFQLIGPDGKAIPMTDDGQKMQKVAQEDGTIGSDPLEPKEQRSFELKLQKVYDLTKPGEYRIVARGRVPKEGKDDLGKNGKLSSNALVIQIVEAKDDQKK